MLAKPLLGVLTAVVIVLSVGVVGDRAAESIVGSPAAGGPPDAEAADALALLEQLPVAGPASGDGYDRDHLFGAGWAPVGDCDVRDLVLARDLSALEYHPLVLCAVVGGVLIDPYSGDAITYEPGTGLVEVDHVVSLYNAWITGAQQWDSATLAAFANDPANLLTVSRRANQEKGAGDAAEWVPPNPAHRCAYATTQIVIKTRYGLWVTPAERRALEGLLQTC
ncbi:HNH endonuclease family protein [Occultella aeris]|uniref:HNH endonuclease family protein n=1 Tax=Occultella aeris TaxID=2761496 RepID=UPI0018D3B685|nr:HNH endonuclease family protein [Occultella aeris]